jgi:formyl-CoA transferase
VIATVCRGDENIKVVTGPAIIDGEKPMPTGYPPSLGEHNREVWGELGLSAKDMEALHEEGIL